jgi:hypothetical protein
MTRHVDLGDPGLDDLLLRERYVQELWIDR